MKMSEGEHESAHFISDIEIPSDLKTVHCLEHDPEADVNGQSSHQPKRRCRVE